MRVERDGDVIEITLNTQAAEQLLSDLSTRLRLRAIREAVRDIGRFGQRKLRDVTPRRTGFARQWVMQKALGREVIHGDSISRVLRRPRVFNLLESGARPHDIWPGLSPRRPGRLSTQSKNPRRALRVGSRTLARVRHPGFPARSGLWSSVVEATRAEAPAILARRVEREVSRARRRSL